MAETKAGADAAFDFFTEAYGVKSDRAAKCLIKDRTDLLAFYDFPAEHWKHFRTSNPIESTFATVRHPTTKTKGCVSRQTALAMTHQLLLSAKNAYSGIIQPPIPKVSGHLFRGIRPLCEVMLRGDL